MKREVLRHKVNGDQPTKKKKKTKRRKKELRIIESSGLRALKWQ